MPVDSQVLKLISELTQLTAQKQIQWEATSAPASLAGGTNDFYPAYFETIFKGQRIGLAQRRYKDYNGEFDTFMWYERFIIIFVDRQNNVVWESSEEHFALASLFEVVRNQVANVEGIFKNLLSR